MAYQNAVRTLCAPPSCTLRPKVREVIGCVYAILCRLMKTVSENFSLFLAQDEQ
jgi:hypothetical protein